MFNRISPTVKKEAILAVVGIIY